jgi:Alginate export
MKKTLFILILLSGAIEIFAQGKGVFNPLRYNDDYSFLRNDTSKNWYDKIKYISLSSSGNTFLSFGGEARYRYFRFENENWGDVVSDKDGYLLSRYLFHADFHLGKHIRTFVQLQSGFATNKMTTSPVDDNSVDLHQAFVDFNMNPESKIKTTLRVGRQELSYGSQRLISTREPPNNRQSFDGVKLMLHSPNNKIDFLYSQYVTAKKGAFNDAIDNAVKLWGVYMVRNKIPVLQNIDVYYLGIQKDRTKFDEGTDKETRHSVGTRIWDSANAWQYDVEGIYQWGEFGAATISAWTASTNISYTFNSKWQPQVGVKTELISGDKTYNDGQLNTFNPLFPRGAYFGLAALIGPANLFDIHPYTELDLTEKIILKVDLDMFWRASESDGIYAPSGQLIYSGKNTTSKKIGQQLGTELIYSPNPFLDVRAEFTWFSADTYLKEVGSGKDILLAVATVQFKF